MPEPTVALPRIVLIALLVAAAILAFGVLPLAAGWCAKIANSMVDRARLTPRQQLRHITDRPKMMCAQVSPVSGLAHSATLSASLYRNEH